MDVGWCPILTPLLYYLYEGATGLDAELLQPSLLKLT